MDLLTDLSHGSGLRKKRGRKKRSKNQGKNNRAAPNRAAGPPGWTFLVRIPVGEIRADQIRPEKIGWPFDPTRKNRNLLPLFLLLLH